MDYDALERLVHLRDQGALSQEEFDEQKGIILGNHGADTAADPVTSKRSTLQPTFAKMSTAVFVIGLLIVLYSTFIYDVTITPMDAASGYSSVDASSSMQDRSSAISEIVDRYDRTLAGERIINLPRVETQRRIFSFGALLAFVGVIGLVAPLVRGRS